MLYMSLDRRQQADLAVTQDSQRLAGLHAVSLEQLVEGTRQLLIAVSQSRDVREGDGAGCSAYLRQLLPHFGSMYSNLGVLDRQGALICSGVTSLTVNLSDREYFKRAIDTRLFVVGEYIVGRLTRKASLPLAYPLLDGQGTVRLVMFATIDLERFNEGLIGQAWPADASVIVTDRSQTIVALRPDGREWLGRSVAKGPVARRIESQEKGVFDFEESGQTDVIAFERVRPLETGLTVRVSRPKTQARTAANWVMYRSLLGFSLVAFLIMLGVMAASERLLLKPLAQLAKASRRLAAGDLGARATSSTSIPELKELGKDFDDMAAAIEEREAARLRLEMERRDLEHQYHQAQKMDAVGRLAGGIAHDFNNMLTAILGYCELLLDDPKVGESQRADVREIEKAGRTAAQLTKQLLAFSRREIVEPIVLDLNDIVASMDNMLRRLVGEHIAMQTDLRAGLHRVRADRGQMEQVVLNLVLNARDAMPGGGRMTILTTNVHLDAGIVSTYLAAPPGHYAMVEVRDEGEGMAPDVLQHLFEPFFTTKSTGKGTGLGLATVYGIVKQNNGGIAVESEAGRGTRLRIYLPRVEEQPTAVFIEKPVTSGSHAKATILIVEDDPGIRELASKVLSRSGYQVLTACGGDEARVICERHGGAIDVLLSDVVMPGMSGPMVAAMVTKIRPSMKVVFMSGYTDDAVVRHGVMERDVPFLLKPFTPERLANKILEVLG